MRYVTRKDSPDEYSPPIYEMGEIKNGKKRVVFTLGDFLISQLDDEYIDEGLFRIISRMWKAGVPEEKVKDYHEKRFYKKNKELYDQEFHALTEMRKKRGIKAKPKRKIVKKKKGCGCK